MLIVLQNSRLRSDTLIDLDNQADNLSSTLTEIDASEADGGVLLNLIDVADSNDTTAPSVIVTTGDGKDVLSNINVSSSVTITTNAGDDTINIGNPDNDEKVNDKKAVVIDSGLEAIL